MSDLIDRQAAIEVMRKAKDKSEAHRMLVQLPSAQQECEDAVSRKAVAGIYTALWEIIGTIMDRDEWDDVCHTTANELPSVTPKQPGWIPVTERLPEYGTTVLTCDHDGEYEINHIIDEEDGEWFLDGAVAWIPIPKPWEGDANG